MSNEDVWQGNVKFPGRHLIDRWPLVRNGVKSGFPGRGWKKTLVLKRTITIFWNIYLKACSYGD